MTEERQKMREKAAKAASRVEADPTLRLKQGWDTNEELLPRYPQRSSGLRNSFTKLITGGVNRQI